MSIACNMGGGGGAGGGGVSEHPLKERRVAPVPSTNSSVALACQSKVRGESSGRHTLMGHAHMKEALGRHGNMKYR